MLHVFQVDTGVMITFDMNLALDCVSALKNAIWTMYRIPIDRQVLLVSGGECLLDSNSRVCTYAAGTDTNPIFLFNKSNIETSSPSSSGQSHQVSPSNPDSISNENIKDQIEGCLKLPPTYVTVVTRAQLAQQLWETSKDMTKRCEQLIYEQHLQHQGWAAVVANLEDIIASFQLKNESFTSVFESFMGDAQERIQLLDSFDQILEGLRKIPILKSIIEDNSNGSVESQPTNLLDYLISIEGSSSRLESLSQSCRVHLEKLKPSVVDALQKEIVSVIEKSNQPSMKEIKGLEERLFGLDQLLLEARKLVQEQQEMAQAFMQNQNRASDLKDSSVLPDLCQSHQHQLLVMSRNYQQLEDIRRRCAKAKEELTENLKARLKWVMMVQRSIVDASSKTSIYLQSLKRIQRQLDMVQQMHSCGALYGKIVHEVLRRKEFSRAFLTWAEKTYEKLKFVLDKELYCRKEFSREFQDHFLSGLFTGLEDYPCCFIEREPEKFDESLPKITSEEIEALKALYKDLDFSNITHNAENLVEDAKNSRSGNPQLESKISELEEQLKHKEAEIRLLNDKTHDQYRLAEEEVKRIRKLNDSLEKNLNIKEEEIKSLQDKVQKLTDQCAQSESELNDKYESYKVNLESRHKKELAELEKCLLDKHKAEIQELMEKHRQDMEGLRSRYKFMTSFELTQKSPSSDSEQKSFEVEKPIDANVAKSPQSKKRERNESEGIVEQIDDSTLDTSAIDAMCLSGNNEGTTDNASGDDISDMLAPPAIVTQVATKLLNLGRISTQSCRVGECSFIYWNEKFQAYTVYLCNKSVHFLHTECIPMIDEDGKVGSCEGFVARVIDKEFCVARRAQNRYHVPQGFHFHRIRVKVIDKLVFSSFVSS